GFPSAFQRKNIAQVVANAPVNGNFGTNYPPDLNQNITGYFSYNAETGLFNGGSDPVSPRIPALPATPAFPSLRGLNKAGTSDQGTRVYARFANLPTGMKLFVPSTIALRSAETANLNQQTGVAVLIST